MRRTDEPMWDRMLREHGEKKAKRALEKELGADARDQSAAGCGRSVGGNEVCNRPKMQFQSVTWPVVLKKTLSGFHEDT